MCLESREIPICKRKCQRVAAADWRGLVKAYWRWRETSAKQVSVKHCLAMHVPWLTFDCWELNGMRDLEGVVMFRSFVCARYPTLGKVGIHVTCA